MDEKQRPPVAMTDGRGGPGWCGSTPHSTRTGGGRSALRDPKRRKRAPPVDRTREPSDAAEAGFTRGRRLPCCRPRCPCSISLRGLLRGRSWIRSNRRPQLLASSANVQHPVAIRRLGVARGLPRKIAARATATGCRAKARRRMASAAGGRGDALAMAGCCNTHCRTAVPRSADGCRLRLAAGKVGRRKTTARINASWQGSCGRAVAALVRPRHAIACRRT